MSSIDLVIKHFDRWQSYTPGQLVTDFNRSPITTGFSLADANEGNVSTLSKRFRLISPSASRDDLRNKAWVIIGILQGQQGVSPTIDCLDFVD